MNILGQENLNSVRISSTLLNTSAQKNRLEGTLTLEKEDTKKQSVLQFVIPARAYTCIR